MVGVIENRRNQRRDQADHDPAEQDRERITLAQVSRGLYGLQGRYLGLMRQIPKTVVKQRFGKDAIKALCATPDMRALDAYLEGISNRDGGLRSEDGRGLDPGAGGLARRAPPV